MIDKVKLKTYLDKSLLDAYQLMLDEENDSPEKYINIFWDLIENTYGYVLKYIRNKIKDAKDIHLNVEDLLYDNLDEDRIIKYFEEFKASDGDILKARIRFLNQLSKIFVTEAGLVRDKSFIEIGRILLTVYHYWIDIVYEESSCGESATEGGTESGEYISTTIKTQAEFDIMLEDFWCGHENCGGHAVDIDINTEEKEEIELTKEDIKMER